VFFQEGSRQAESNLKFLLVLKDPCHELSDAKPADIPKQLPKILNLIRMIWVNSEFYKSRERLAGILKKVGETSFTLDICFYTTLIRVLLLDIAALIITLFGPHWQHCKDINHSYDLC
jgi:hypothetical protein